ncbi:hypothetical protein BO83DRAFT_377264 [Aspergillus eucalypticola CBS 122712]|uniref:Uncharacterized protein n=1 Tax=Aspergillus eucalypticola (strain CBS 122712 / IBT 29274) TaxID=1448314 RepID=A0A317VT99_ASPEC|nr:uncharacterized protein BO83DRAFT_377264 [Aspergillus eucalypticola CBS 122712]PWY76789.1 hypothetical protein BO83DRAFT_377264 [Aspergillus eucalypticola CBS 122712]
MSSARYTLTRPFFFPLTLVLLLSYGSSLRGYLLVFVGQVCGQITAVNVAPSATSKCLVYMLDSVVSLASREENY